MDRTKDINWKTKRQKYICPDFFVMNNKKVTDKTEIDELFNNHFANVGKTSKAKYQERMKHLMKI